MVYLLYDAIACARFVRVYLRPSFITFRRIRDQLLHDDRFSLAMEISTKCNLDTTGVWAAWGMSWLKVGNFEKAREKLRHCFMV